MPNLDSEIREAIRVKELNVELMEHLTFTADWLLRYCEKNNVTPPSVERLIELIHRAKGLIQKICQPYIPTDFQQRNKTPDDSTEPNFLMTPIRSDILPNIFSQALSYI